jgi:endonuclease VIII
VAEGDTIHRLARRFDAKLGGREITVARAPSPRSPLHRGAERLAGRELRRARARGKHLLLEFEGDLWLRSHLKMNGAWDIYAPGERWRKGESRAWLVLESETATAVQYDGPELELLPRSRIGIHPRLARLGPDILGPDFTAEAGAAALRGTADPRREIGDAILDQSLIAGVGNIFKSEGLHRARIDPWRRVSDLSERELLAAVEETRVLMAEAVESGRQPKRIYKGHGRPCPRCGELIKARGQGDDNRTTYWCPGCQM